jgi:hypothetical protein
VSCFAAGHRTRNHLNEVIDDGMLPPDLRVEADAAFALADFRF